MESQRQADLAHYVERMRFHINRFEEASAEYFAADEELQRKYGRDGANLRIARRDDHARGDAFKSASFHIDAATMYASAASALRR